MIFHTSRPYYPKPSFTHNEKEIIIPTTKNRDIRLSYEKYPFDTPQEVIDHLFPCMELIDEPEPKRRVNIVFVQKVIERQSPSKKFDYSSPHKIYGALKSQGYDHLSLLGLDIVQYDFTCFSRQMSKMLLITDENFTIPTDVDYIKDKTNIHYITAHSWGAKILIGVPTLKEP